MKNVRKYLLGIGMVLLFVFAVVKVLAIRNTTTEILPTIFRDIKNGTVLSLQLATGRSDTGEFYFTVPNIGYYHGIVPIKNNGNPQGTVTAQFYPISGGAGASATITLNGQVHQNSASIKITVDKTRYTLTTAQVDTTAATTTAQQAMSDTTTKNWTDLYTLLSTDVQSNTTQSQFIQSMTGSPNIVSSSLNGSGSSNTVGGYTYFSQPVVLTVQNSDGTTTTYHANEYFVLEQGVWRLLSTDTPTQQ